MTVREARAILREMEKWRRGLPPYDGDTPRTHIPMPHTLNECFDAIGIVLEALKEKKKKEENANN